MKALLKIQIAKDPSEEISDAIRKPLREYSEAFLGKYSSDVYAVYIREEEKIIAGIYGWLSFGWLFIDWAWVREDLRGNGYGKMLLAKIELIAKEEGFFHARLNTANFQALPFYKKNGYKVFAELPCTAKDAPNEPFDFIDYFLKKNIININLEPTPYRLGHYHLH